MHNTKGIEKRMIQKAIAFMEKYNMISENDLVAAGVSGGADSLCLLFVLLEYQKRVPFDLVVVHVNHMIREDACHDEEFVREICDRKKIPFYVKRADVKNLARGLHMSEEETGRKVRYEAFREALEISKKSENQRGKIAVAHHQGDSAETVLFHFFRGTGIYGMAGIMPVHDNIIRPLLNCSRKEIEEYLVNSGLEWCIDCTNGEDTYTRNKIRHHILGYADKEINDKATEHIAKAALQMVSLREYLEFEVAKMMTEIAETGQESIVIHVEKLKVYPEFLQNQFLLSVMDKMIPGRKDIGSEHIQGIWNLLAKTGTKKMNLPGDLEAVKEYQTLRIKKQKTPDDAENEQKELCLIEKEKPVWNENSTQIYCLKDGTRLEISFRIPEDLERIEENKYTKYFDYDKINNCLSLRFRQSGDYIFFNDKGQKKSLKEYFIHEKIPASVRDKVPLIADGNHILWIVGYRISAYYKITKETKRIIQITIRRDKDVRKN